MPKNNKIIGFFLICTLALALLIKGKPGISVSGLAFQDDSDTSVTGPFESSNSSSRYGLTEAIVNDHRLTLDLTQARLGAPDLVYYRDQFQSIFTPGIAFVAVPFLWAGNLLQVPQLGAYLSTIIFALINTYLVYRLARHFSASQSAALLAAFTFLFGSNALVYALTLTQHHGSITVLLLAILISQQKISWKNCLIFGLLCGVGLLFDYPNLFLLFPIGIYILVRAISLSVQTQKLKVTIYPQLIAIAIGLIPLIGLYGWYNQQVSGSPLVVGQFVGRTNYFDTQAKKDADQVKALEKAKDPYAPKLPFQTRVQLQGLYILAVSNERSWIFYSPVILIGLLGLWYLLRKPETQTLGVLLFSIIAVNFLIYSMFDDPWGGWAFGPRYLLPSAAILASLIGVALTHYKSIFVKIAFAGLLIYSVAISAVGAVTSASIPPKQEAINLLTPVPYTFAYNFSLLHQQKLGALVFNVFGHYFVSGQAYYALLLVIILSLGSWLFITYLRDSKTTQS